MFRILSKLRRKLLSENRFSRYIIYATGEIALVVIGILLALAANNWNIQRNNVKAEIKLLQQLENEFVENLNALNQNIRLRDIMGKSIYTLRDYFLNGADGVPIDSLQKHRALTYYNVKFNGTNGVTNLLLNSGELSLIQDDDLKIRLSNWSGTVKSMTEEEDLTVNYLLTQYFNYTNHHYDAVKLAGEYDQMRDSGFTDPLQDDTEDLAEPTLYSDDLREFDEWSRWLTDQIVINYVLQIGTRNKIANSKAKQVRLENELILDLIRENLDQR